VKERAVSSPRTRRHASPRRRLAWAALAGLAATALGAASCDLVLDIGGLDRGNPPSPDGGRDGGNDSGRDAGSLDGSDGGGLDGSSDGGDGGDGVEIVATGQCYPGDLTLVDGFLYWGTTAGPGACSGADAIVRMALPEAGVVGSPTTVVSHDLGGADAGGRAWTIAVVADKVYWLGCGTLCTAQAGQEAQQCTLALKSPACASGFAAAGSTVVYAGGCGGTCSGPGTGKGSFESFDTLDGGVSALGFTVAGEGGIGAVSASDDPSNTPPLWFAWIDASNCVRLGAPGMAGWSSCVAVPGSQAFPGAIVNDGEQIYWMAVGAENTYDLLGRAPQNSMPTTLVTGIGAPLGMALDGDYVYFTAEDQGGSVYAVSRVLGNPTPVTQVMPLAKGRAQAQHSGPFRITAADPTWLYWVNVEPDGTVERILKPH
jgi:hypothetical protein